MVSSDYSCGQLWPGFLLEITIFWDHWLLGSTVLHLDHETDSKFASCFLQINGSNFGRLRVGMERCPVSLHQRLPSLLSPRENLALMKTAEGNILVPWQRRSMGVSKMGGPKIIQNNAKIGFLDLNCQDCAVFKFHPLTYGMFGSSSILVGQLLPT